ncbi:MAG TPA: hypothetical protein VF701_21940 [Thermoanaerobaculia bacterium]
MSEPDRSRVHRFVLLIISVAALTGTSMFAAASGAITYHNMDLLLGATALGGGGFGWRIVR